MASPTVSTEGGVVLGIDFGTSYTSAGAFIRGQIDLVRDNGDPMIPSVAYVPPRGDLVIGTRALPYAVHAPHHTVASVKRLLGVRGDPASIRRIAPTVAYPIAVGAGGRVHLRLHNQDWTTVQIAAAILAHVRDLAERRFGTVSGAVLTVSAVATRAEREALLDAARLARLEVVALVAEPIAGAIALGMHVQPTARRVLVCDFGGGTFDVTLIEQTGTRFTVAATGGDRFLGGDDLDHAMSQAVGGAIYRRCQFDITHDLVRRQLLAQRCEGVKRVLSTRPEARLTMRDAYIDGGERCDLDLPVTRSWCEALWRPLFDRALAEVDRVLAESQWSASDLEEIGLIGGTAMVPLFRQLIQARFPRVRVSLSDDAHVAVAMGAALLAARGSAHTVVTATPEHAAAQ